MIRIGDKFHQALLLKPIDQNLNVLAGAESRPSDLRDGLGAIALKKLKSSPTGTWERCSRVGGLETIGQSIDFDKQSFKTLLQYGSVRCYRGIHGDTMVMSATYCQQLAFRL